MTASVSVHEAAEAARNGATIVDVRTAPEFDAGHVPQSVFMPLATVPLRLTEFDGPSPVYVICESGARSFQACQFLEQRGYAAINVLGGMAAWRLAGLPVDVTSPAN